MPGPLEVRLRCLECGGTDFRLFAELPLFEWHANVRVECSACGTRASVGVDHEHQTRKMMEER